LKGSFEEHRAAVLSFIRGQRQGIQMTLLHGDLRSRAKVSIIEPSPKAPATQADLARVLATVDGTPITSGEVEEALRLANYGYRMQVYAVEKQALDVRVDTILITQEAAKRGVSVDTLVAKEIEPNVRKVDVFEASKFYNENKDRFGSRSFAAVKDDILAAMKEAARNEAIHAFAEGLKKNGDVKVSLLPPAEPTFAVDAPGRPTKGAANAAVTIVEFSDFECPQCAKAHAQLDEVAKEFPGKVKFVARHFPLQQHTNSFKAAEASEAAAEQGKYWEYAALLFANQQDLSVGRLKELATEAGLDRTKFDAALDSGKFTAVVQKEFEDAVRLGVSGTPAFYVNGKVVEGNTGEALKEAIRRAMTP
jgi:protein-disulfide isomerase